MIHKFEDEISIILDRTFVSSVDNRTVDAHFGQIVKTTHDEDFVLSWYGIKGALWIWMASNFRIIDSESLNRR
jgi:hypothetical protein